MNFTRRTLTVLLFFVSGFAVSNAVAQDQTQDYCQRHPELFDSNGKLTLEAHKKLHHLDGSEWWYDSQAKDWKPWTSKTNTHALEEHQELTDGPDWWFDSQTKEWKPWPNRDKQMSLDCYKKLYGEPNWWYDSQAKEWKPWPMSK